MSRWWLLAPVLVAVVLLDGYVLVNEFRTRTSGDVSADAKGGDLTVHEAATTELDREVIVTGYVFIDEHTGMLLCSQRTREDRPACKGNAVTLQGLDPTRLAVERASEPEGGFDAWVDDPVRLQVRARGATLVVEDVLPSS